ncbi:hypothetical protein JCM5353_003989 [Sporobolomyces roseus]
MSSKTLAIILGAGPGTGQAIAQALARDGSSVALLARSETSLNQVADAVKAEGGHAVPFTCDASSPSSIRTTFSSILSHFPSHTLTRAYFNATNPFLIKPFLELTQDDLKPGLELNVNGAVEFSQCVIREMLKNESGRKEGKGFLCFSGATAATKGSAKFAGFAPAKFALRGLAQSLAREFGPQGIHVSHAIIDGLIDTDRIQGMMGKGEPDTRLDPNAIADSLVWLSKQPKNCWTHELDLRPGVEKW